MYTNEVMYIDKDGQLHCRPYTDQHKAKTDFQSIRAKLPDVPARIHGRGRDGKYHDVTVGDVDFDEITSITVKINYGYGTTFTYLSHKYREGKINIRTKKGHVYSLPILECKRRLMDDIWDEVLAAGGEELHFIEEVLVDDRRV